MALAEDVGGLPFFCTQGDDWFDSFPARRKNLLNE